MSIRSFLSFCSGWRVFPKQVGGPTTHLSSQQGMGVGEEWTDTKSCLQRETHVWLKATSVFPPSSLPFLSSFLVCYGMVSEFDNIEQVRPWKPKSMRASCTHKVNSSSQVRAVVFLARVLENFWTGSFSRTIHTGLTLPVIRQKTTVLAFISLF